MELDDKEEVYHSTDADVIDRWLTPGYKLTWNEERHAKEMTDEYFSGGLLLKEVFRNMVQGKSRR